MGFSVPIDRWLRGQLRPWADELLSEQDLSESRLLAVAPVRAMWTGFLAQRGVSGLAFWAILNLLAWQRYWRPKVH